MRVLTAGAGAATAKAIRLLQENILTRCQSVCIINMLTQSQNFAK